MPKKKSEQGSIIAFFSLSSLDVAENVLGIVQEVMRRRRREGKAGRPKKEKAVGEKKVIGAVEGFSIST